MIMKRTSILFCSLILLFCAVSAPATAVDTVELIAAAPSAADHPGSDAIVLLEEVGYEVDAGGLMTHRVRTVTKLLTDWSVRNLTDPRIDWDSSRQELIIHTARSFMRDGSEVPTPENGFNEVTADAVRKFASGLSYREMVVSHVGAEIDGVIELDYEIRDLRPGPLPAGGKEELAGPWPILRKTVTVNAVSGASAEIAGAGLLQNPPVVTESAADDHVSVWTVSDVPAFPLDGSNDRRGDLRPALYFSTVGDWRELALRMRILGDQAVVADGLLQSWVDHPLNDAGESSPDLSPLDTVQRIADLVGNRIRTVRPEPDWSRPPRATTAVFAGLKGTPWEKAVLAESLLKAAGLSAEIGFFGPGLGFPVDAATQHAFTDVRVAVRVDDRNWWLDPDSGRAFPGRCDLVGRTGFFLEDSTAAFRRYIVSGLPGGSDLLVDIEAATDEDWRAEVEFEAGGALWEMDPDDTPDSLAERLAGDLLAEAVVENLEILDWSPFKVHLRFSATGSPPAVENGLIVIDVPRPPIVVADVLPQGFRANASRRSADLLIDLDLVENVRLRLSPSPEMLIDHLPAAADLVFGDNRLRIDSSEQDGVVVIERSLAIAAGRVPATDHQAFRSLVAAAERPDSRSLVLSAE